VASSRPQTSAPLTLVVPGCSALEPGHQSHRDWDPPGLPTPTAGPVSGDLHTDRAGPMGRLVLDPVLVSSLGQLQPAAGAGGPPAATVQVEGEGRAGVEADSAEAGDRVRCWVVAVESASPWSGPGRCNGAGPLTVLVGVGSATPSRSALDPTPEPVRATRSPHPPSRCTFQHKPSAVGGWADSAHPGRALALGRRTSPADVATPHPPVRLRPKLPLQ
jgi:hypothetical protein